MTAAPAGIVFLLCTWFCAIVLRQYVRKHRLSHLFWALSLGFSAAASLCYCLTLWTHPHSSWWFVGYYILGAMWMPSLMGLGSLSLVSSSRVVKIYAGMISMIGLVGTVLLVNAQVSATAVQDLNGGAGTGVIADGVWLFPLITLNTFGAATVVLVALWSAWRTLRGRAPVRFFHGNLWLALGVLVISAAGSAARLGLPQMFWVVMLVGWILTYVGYALLSPKSSPHVQDVTFS